MHRRGDLNLRGVTIRCDGDAVCNQLKEGHIAVHDRRLHVQTPLTKTLTMMAFSTAPKSTLPRVAAVRTRSMLTQTAIPWMTDWR